MAELDIYNCRVRKVFCVSNKDHKFFDCDENAPMLTVGDTYTLVGVEIHGRHTVVYLEEFPGVGFNSSCFDEI